MLVLRIVKTLRGIRWIVGQGTRVNTGPRRVAGLLGTSLRLMHVRGLLGLLHLMRLLGASLRLLHVRGLLGLLHVRRLLGTSLRLLHVRGLLGLLHVRRLLRVLHVRRLRVTTLRLRYVRSWDRIVPAITGAGPGRGAWEGLILGSLIHLSLAAQVCHVL